MTYKVHKDKQHVSTYGRYAPRGIYVYIVAISFALLTLIFLLHFNRFYSDENYTFITNNQKTLDTTNGHYNILFAISTKINNVHHRRILREYLFGTHNNLQPCTHQSGDVYYKFLVEPYNIV